jgi:chemotaxis signal transduction protein
MEAAQVRGILPLSELVFVPRARHGLLGVVTISGQTVNVIDLSAKLRLPASRPGSQPKIVVLEVTAEHRQYLAGFIADRVSDVGPIPPAMCTKAPCEDEGAPAD